MREQSRVQKSKTWIVEAMIQGSKTRSSLLHCVAWIAPGMVSSTAQGIDRSHDFGMCAHAFVVGFDFVSVHKNSEDY